MSTCDIQGRERQLRRRRLRGLVYERTAELDLVNACIAQHEVALKALNEEGVRAEAKLFEAREELTG